MKESCKIVVADDHEIVRKGIVQLLSTTEGIAVEGEAASGAELIVLIQNGEWDAVIMDLQMPGLSGVELLKHVQRLRPKLPVLILSVQPESISARRLLQAGAAGYLSKETVAQELIVAVRKVCAGGRYVSAALAEQIAFSLDATADRPPHELLSNREFEVLQMLASGVTPTEIAEKLSLSIKTVSTYRTRILEKMQFSTTAELMKYAIKNGIVE